jgi:hypothetical protein
VQTLLQRSGTSARHAVVPEGANLIRKPLCAMNLHLHTEGTGAQFMLWFFVTAGAAHGLTP